MRDNPNTYSPELEELRETLIKLAAETGHSYEAVLRCALSLFDCILREVNVLAH